MKTNLKKDVNIFTFGTPIGSVSTAASAQQSKLSAFNDYACVPNAMVNVAKDKAQNGTTPFYF